MKRKCHFDMMASKALTLKFCEVKRGLEIVSCGIISFFVLMRNKNLCMVRKLPRKTCSCFISS